MTRAGDRGVRQRPCADGVGGRLIPSLIRTLTVGSLLGIHRHIAVAGRGLVPGRCPGADHR
jgi:hypothetical protein